MNKEELKEYNKKYYQENKHKWKRYSKSNRDSNKEKIKEYQEKYRISNSEALKEYRKNNKEYMVLYREHNKDQINKTHNIYIKTRSKNDLAFKLRCNFSSKIRKQIFLKNGNSILKFLPYTIQELKLHLEKQFESWMTWENHGVYNVKIWQDNDQSTWTWQIDHIIPQSDFTYTSMEDENFKKCWSLENLRPYSAKQNIIDGARINF